MALKANTENAREQARLNDGKFGHQQHPEPPAGLTLSLPEPSQEAPAARDEAWVKGRAAELYEDPHPGLKGDQRVTEDCGSCAGSGVYKAPSKVNFFTPATGTSTTGCFYCHGTGKHTRLVSSARSTARNLARRQAQCEAESEVLKARWDRLREEQQPLRDDLDTLFATVPERLWPSGSEHMHTNLKAYGEYPTLQEDEASDLHTEVLKTRLDYASRGRVPASEKRLRVTGKVLAVKYQESGYPGRAGTFKMLVEASEGWKVWGTRPSGAAIERGDTIAFDAKIDPSDDDPTFGFFSRPTKPEVIEAAPVDGDG